ncbi:putative OTU domain, MULE transposase domain, FHY3/FAR1 family [Helianthus annuus]|uniref:OTU domain, MULE transposase domain, FHY3/FAR1 family n=5 Tax=Helianthus annuus TaxID=4232 RepID=A0A9K3HKU9_HELAN|nr:putative OTU domain, MULE transposase domain, FHY3/FAR1 family [Helianthus annuus]
MPFIQIVGMTPTNKSFIIAHAVVSKERGDNFVWVLERVKAMLDECMEPRVILTDRDLALMGACAKVFPDASRLLCRWHIQQNVMKHCKGAFTDDDWKTFLSFWGSLIESPSIPIYDYHLRNMRKRLVECKRSRVFKYVYDNWLKDYKEMFVFAWTDKRRNFGNRTTNRVESQHANLKRYVEDRSSLDRIVGCVRDIVETQFGEIRKTFRESIEKTMKHHKHPMFQHLLGKVSHKALDLLHGEAIRRLDVLERFNSSCGCQMWHSCGLPCACRIEKYMREEHPIQLEDIDVFWRKLNFQSCKLIDDSLDVVEELDVVRQQLQSHPPAQQKSLLSKIKAVLTPTKSTKKPPVVQQNTRGRPTTKQVQERLDEASRIDEELRRSSFGDANTCFEGSRQSKYDKPRHSSYVPSQASQQSVIRSQKPKATLSRSKSSKKKETRDDHGFPLIIGDEYVGIIERFKSDIPPVFHPYVSCIRDVMPDGHCGFRSVAVGLGMDQSSWGRIRRDLVQEMDQNESIWFPIFEAWAAGYFYTHRQGLIWDSVAGCGENHWMDFPFAGLLIAQTYGIGVHLLTTTMGASSTYFPILSPPANQQPLFITLTHVNENHFIHVKLEGDYPMPPAHGLWLTHRRPHTEQWEDMYLPRLEWYTSIMNPRPRSNPSLNYIDSYTEE